MGRATLHNVMNRIVDGHLLQALQGRERRSRASRCWRNGGATARAVVDTSVDAAVARTATRNDACPRRIGSAGLACAGCTGTASDRCARRGNDEQAAIRRADAGAPRTSRADSARDASERNAAHRDAGERRTRATSGFGRQVQADEHDHFAGDCVEAGCNAGERSQAEDARAGDADPPRRDPVRKLATCDEAERSEPASRIEQACERAGIATGESSAERARRAAILVATGERTGGAVGGFSGEAGE